MDSYARHVGAAAGRGDYQASQAATEIVTSCRRRLMKLIHAHDANQIAFFHNGTAALNAAIFGMVRPGDHVVASAIEHNSVLRPLEHLRSQGTITLDMIPCDSYGYVDIGQMLDRVTDDTALVVLAHASNVTGAIQDVTSVGKTLRDHQAILLCDAAQSLGYLPIDVGAMGINMLASPGHKGTCGPLGTAMLWVDNQSLRRLRPTIFGGTGSISESLEMPAGMPEMLEAGNLNVPAIAGWDAALRYLESTQGEFNRIDSIMGLRMRMLERFGDFRFGHSIVGASLPIASILFDQITPSLVGGLLASEFGVEVRCGLHCAAKVHDAIRQAHGIAPSDYQGTLRISAGHFTSIKQIDDAADALETICESL